MAMGLGLGLGLPMETLTGGGLAPAVPLFELEDNSGTIALETSGSIQLES